MLIPSDRDGINLMIPSLSRRVNANSQPASFMYSRYFKLIKKGEC